MKRRTILKRLGAVGAATTAMAGTATAKTSATGFELDRPLDVSELSGEYVLADLLTEEELAAAEDVAALREQTIVIEESAEEIGTLDDCCCCDGSTPGCDGYCCDCPMQ